MYKNGDSVRVWHDSKLLDGEYCVTSNCGGKIFNVAKLGDLNIRFKGVERNHIMYDHEVNKVIILSLRRELQRVSELRDLELDNATFFDTTLGEIAGNFDGWSNVRDFYSWFDNGQFGVDGNSRVVYCEEDDEYYIWIDDTPSNIKTR